MFSEEQKTAIAKAIHDNIGQYTCPMCGEHKFSIVDEFGLHMMRPLNNPTNVSWGVPYIMLICNKCGNMSQHNALSLGIIDAEDAQTILSSLERIANQDK